MRGRVGTPQREIHLFYGTPLYNKGIMKGWIKKLEFSKSEVARFRLEVINFYDKHGLSATIDAYGVSRATIFRWKKSLKSSGGKLESLIPKSKAPKRRRKMTTPPEIIDFIKDLREKHPRIGKEKIKPLLDEYCKERGLKTVSASTIGKIIKRYKLFYSRTGRVYHNPNSKWANKGRSYRARVKRSPKEKEGGYIEIDSITKFVDGIRVYIINAIDVKFRLNFAYAYSSLSSNNALDFFKKLEEVYPYERGIRVVQTDNGSEFLGVFDKYLKERGIEHKFTYPRCPKINGYIERANRTLKEEFLEENIYLVVEGINELNSSLIDYVIWYNTKRVHKSLNNLSPIDYMLKCNPESQMYVTHTGLDKKLVVCYTVASGLTTSH